MSRLVWHRPGSHRYENGIDQGVLYLPDGSAVPWNGLTEIDKKSERDANPVYFDGRKINDGVSVGDFSATLKAITYPEEMELLEGAEKMRNGVTVGDQPPKTFALCYRTMIGNEIEGEGVGYKINVIWNLTAIPNDRTYASVSDDPEIVEFEWDLVAVPEDIPGMRPTAHITLDTRYLDPWLIEDLEKILYGNSGAEASLIPMVDFITFLQEWYRVKIIDHGNGTWSAIEQRPGFITFIEEDWFFTITKIKAVYIDADTYEISDTMDISDTPRIVIYDNGDGTWTASTDDDGVIVVEDDGSFEIRSIDVIFSGPDMYRISSMDSDH